MSVKINAWLYWLLFVVSVAASVQVCVLRIQCDEQRKVIAERDAHVKELTDGWRDCLDTYLRCSDERRQAIDEDKECIANLKESNALSEEAVNIALKKALELHRCDVLAGRAADVLGRMNRKGCTP